MPLINAHNLSKIVRHFAARTSHEEMLALLDEAGRATFQASVDSVDRTHNAARLHPSEENKAKEVVMRSEHEGLLKRLYEPIINKIADELPDVHPVVVMLIAESQAGRL